MCTQPVHRNLLRRETPTDRDTFRLNPLRPHRPASVPVGANPAVFRCSHSVSGTWHSSSVLHPVANVTQVFSNAIQVLALNFHYCVFDCAAGAAGRLQLCQQSRQVRGCKTPDSRNPLALLPLLNCDASRLFFRRDAFCMLFQGRALASVLQLVTTVAPGWPVERCTGKKSSHDSAACSGLLWSD